MINTATFRQLALSFDKAVEQPHFEKISFRVKKKIFAIFDKKEQRAVLKLSLIDQSAFYSFNTSVIYPVNGTWGKQGWTIVELKKIQQDMFLDALTTAYCHVAPKKLAEKYYNS